MKLWKIPLITINLLISENTYFTDSNFKIIYLPVEA